MSEVSEKDLNAELEDIREYYPALKDDELFVAWFLQSFVTSSVSEAVQSLVGGAKDKNLDAVFIDDDARAVFLVQGKYRQKLNAINESRNDVTSFAGLAHAFSDDESYKIFKGGLTAIAAGKADEAYKRIKNRGYRLQFYYVTTGKCSTPLAKEADSIVRKAGCSASIDVIGGSRVLRLLSDYLDGVAPPVPLLEIELENGHGVALKGFLQRYDSKTKIESWVVPVAVDQISRMYEYAGVRLFARNIRGYLGETQVNQNMKQTLENEPEYFWYYNNGVTIVCDSAEQVSRAGKTAMRLVNPQIINGQQTTRTLHECASKSSNATVLVRVISVPRDDANDAQRFDSLVSRIVAATNWQNAIRASDLMSNDRLQVLLERNLRKIDYQYLRKRQSKTEAKHSAGIKHRFIVSKEELAQVSAACDLDPLVVREGKEQLFEERFYTKVFPNSDPNYYLTRYWLSRHVSREAKGFPERAYAKWLVLHFVWQRVSPMLSMKAKKHLFRVESEKLLFDSLGRAIDAAFRGASSYYRSNSGAGDKRIDPSAFFKHKNHHKEFEKFWVQAPSGHKTKFDKALNVFRRELEDIASQ
jgi:hypothetical protein